MKVIQNDILHIQTKEMETKLKIEVVLSLKCDTHQHYPIGTLKK